MQVCAILIACVHGGGVDEVACWPAAWPADAVLWWTRPPGPHQWTIHTGGTILLESISTYTGSVLREMLIDLWHSLLILRLPTVGGRMFKSGSCFEGWFVGLFACCGVCPHVVLFVCILHCLSACCVVWVLWYLSVCMIFCVSACCGVCMLCLSCVCLLWCLSACGVCLYVVSVSMLCHLHVVSVCMWCLSPCCGACMWCLPACCGVCLHVVYFCMWCLSPCCGVCLHVVYVCMLWCLHVVSACCICLHVVSVYSGVCMLCLPACGVCLHVAVSVCMLCLSACCGVCMLCLFIVVSVCMWCVSACCGVSVCGVQVDKEVQRVDGLLGELMDSLYQHDLHHCVNLILLSDHGLLCLFCSSLTVFPAYRLPCLFCAARYRCHTRVVRQFAPCLFCAARCRRHTNVVRQFAPCLWLQQDVDATQMWYVSLYLVSHFSKMQTPHKGGMSVCILSLQQGGDATSLIAARCRRHTRVVCQFAPCLCSKVEMPHKGGTSVIAALVVKRLTCCVQVMVTLRIENLLQKRLSVLYYLYHWSLCKQTGCVGGLLLINWLGVLVDCGW